MMKIALLVRCTDLPLSAGVGDAGSSARPAQHLPLWPEPGWPDGFLYKTRNQPRGKAFSSPNTSPPPTTAATPEPVSAPNPPAPLYATKPPPTSEPCTASAQASTTPPPAPPSTATYPVAYCGQLPALWLCPVNGLMRWYTWLFRRPVRPGWTGGNGWPREKVWLGVPHDGRAFVSDGWWPTPVGNVTWSLGWLQPQIQLQHRWWGHTVDTCARTHILTPHSPMPPTPHTKAHAEISGCLQRSRTEIKSNLQPAQTHTLAQTNTHWTLNGAI